MRDILVSVIVFGLLPVALVRPYVGVLLWTWLSVMNPHKLTYGFAFDFPFAYIVAVTTLIGVLVGKAERRFPITPITITLLCFIAWMCLTTVFAYHPNEVGEQFSKVMKIMLMILVAILVIHSKEEINRLIWVLAISVGFYGVKGGLFTLVSGGNTESMARRADFSRRTIRWLWQRS